jgi:hypothetical protein
MLGVDAYTWNAVRMQVSLSTRTDCALAQLQLQNQHSRAWLQDANAHKNRAMSAIKMRLVRLIKQQPRCHVFVAGLPAIAQQC